MAKGKKKGAKTPAEEPSKVQQFLREEMERERDLHEFERDGEFIPPEIGGSRYTESARALASDERVIDELLASVPQNQGFYLKLYKELRPNDFELKLRVDNYSNWSDIEWEVTSLVRAYTLKDPKKWGTGRYRIIIWRDGGIRGEKFRPLDFFVDAMEPAHTDPPVNASGGIAPSEALSSQLEGINAMIKTMREVNPTVSPADIQKTMSESLVQGMKLATDSQANKASESSAMMTAMMGFMGILVQTLKPAAPLTPPDSPTKTMAELMTILKSAQPATPQESFTDQIMKMRELGLIEKPEKNDPMAKMAEMKNLMGMLADFGGYGKGDRPGLMEKIVETVGPQIPGMITNITNAVRSVIDYRMMREGLITKTDLGRAEGAIPAHLPVNRKPTAAQPNPQPPEDQSMFMVKQLLTELHQIVSHNDESKFQYIAERITQLFGSPQVLNDLASGTVAQETLISQLKAFGGPDYQDATFMVALDNYFGRFVNWLREALAPAPAGVYTVVCSNPACNAIFDYDSEQEYDNDLNKNCDQCGMSLTKPHVSSDVIQ